MRTMLRAWSAQRMAGIETASSGFDSRSAYAGSRGVAGQQVLDVRDEQLLVLLFMVKADFDALRKVAPQVGAKAGAKQSKNCGVDAFAIAGYLVVPGPRQKPSRWTVVLLADRVVVAIEQHGIGLRGKALHTGGAEHEGFEEPCRVGAVPFDGTRLGHALSALVFR